MLKKIFDIIRAIITMPILILKMSEDLKKLEQKVDSLIEKQENTIKEKLDNQFLQTEALLSIYNMLPNIQFLPPTRGWAGSPDFLAKISELILKEKPNYILEAGSGVSTVIIGHALQSNGSGNVISLDHDKSYIKVTNQNLSLNKIKNTTQVIHCNLRGYNISGQNWLWYNTENLNISKIDMLIIDGPPGSTQYLARYPAIPLLYQFFSDKITIVLDDAKRKEEVIIFQKWIDFLEQKKFHVVVSSPKFDNFEKGLAILEAYRFHESL